MKKVFDFIFKAGFRKELYSVLRAGIRKVTGYILKEGLKNTDEPRLFRDLFPNTELGVDLKLLTRKPGRLPVGGMTMGIITRDDEDHFTFTEAEVSKAILKF